MIILFFNFNILFFLWGYKQL
uniref:Translational initiation factor 1 n=1 Tax=Parkia timoriana TaxID=139018 RepID=A0A977X366_9FABA|nr:translational initiation factor 1 [Parkia timoriana]UXN45342.1 translational initiation factor 1 [Parkia timoriana]